MCKGELRSDDGLVQILDVTMGSHDDSPTFDEVTSGTIQLREPLKLFPISRINHQLGDNFEVELCHFRRKNSS